MDSSIYNRYGYSSFFNPIRKKLIAAVIYGYENHKRKNSGNFNKTEHILILAIFYSLLRKDIALYYILQDIVKLPKTDLLEYSSLFLWMRDEFNFSYNDVKEVLSFAGYIAREGEMNLPQQVLAIFVDLLKNYYTSSEFKQKTIDHNQYKFPATLYFTNKGERRSDKKDILDQTLDRGIVKLLARPICEKIKRAVMFLLNHRINQYPLDITPEEIMSLVIFYSLHTREIALCRILQDMLLNAELDYSHLYALLKYEFEFEIEVVLSSVSNAFLLTEKGVLDLPHHLVLFNDLRRYYLTEQPFYSEEITNWFGKIRERRLGPKDNVMVRMVSKFSNTSRLQEHKTKESVRYKLQKSPLHVAASLGDASAVHLLALHYRSVEPLDVNGWTPLHEAVNGLHFETVRVLLELGAGSKVSDNQNLTPVGLAQRKKSQAMLKLFEKYSERTANKDPTFPKYDINKRDLEGRTALHILAGFGMAEEVGRFLVLGADFNLRDKKRKTPLHHAIASRDHATIRLLSEAIALFDIGMKIS
ncbi:ankyrin-2 [Halyomorpha halys]|uniref:ankyrin-2 n=1 Tax=Halyomorpha halys TaxID=286706 RepID=UPI0006D4F34E|nr:ankyrin-2 [Halyomorpha halys]